MKNHTLAILSTLILIGAACASDWPQWRGPERTGYVPAGVPVPTELPAAPKVLWRMPVAEGMASPAVAGGKVFYLDIQQTIETVHSADAATGKEHWRAPLMASFRDGFGTGPRCTPVVDGDRVYAQSCQGELQCLNAADGTLIWKKNYVTDFGAVFIGEKGDAVGATRHGNTGSPIVDGDNLIALVGSKKDAGIVCFKKLTGEVVWKSQSEQAAYAPPIIAALAGARQLIAFMADSLMALNPADGRLLWRVPLKTNFARHITTPVVVDDRVLVSSHTAGLVCVRVAADAKEPGGFKAEQAWLEKRLSVNVTSPVAVGQFLYALGPAKNLICVDTQTGKVAWEQKGLIGNPDSGKAIANFIVMGQNILMLNDSGLLVLFAANSQAYKEIGRAQICGQTWNNPAYADGKLFLRDLKELLCVELMK